MAKKHSQNISKKKTSAAVNEGTEEREAPNRPRNFYVTDATKPFFYSFKGRFNIQHSLTIHQTPEEETWPGGALWDLGVLISNVMLGIGGVAAATTTTSCDDTSGKPRSKNHVIKLPGRLVDSGNDLGWIRASFLSDKAIVLELGCGVGLTGLAAAAALRPQLVLLTDLGVVIEKVTQQNVLQNTEARKPHRSLGNATCIATPLCWGFEQDEEKVADLIKEFQTSSCSSKRKTKKSPSRPDSLDSTGNISANHLGKADVILIADVAYQQRPGAPSHFEALHSTLLKFIHDDTVLVFGTRIRMPASNDLLQLFLQDLEELVMPPLEADEIEPLFGKVKHNTSIHFMKKRAKSAM